MNRGTITRCHVSIKKTDPDSLPIVGLAGLNSGTICHCAVQIDEGRVLAGLVGGNGDRGDEGLIVGSYAATPEPFLWVPGGKVSGCYFLVPLPTIEDIFDEAGPGYGVPLLDTQMRRQESFIGWDFVGTDDDGTDDIWAMPKDGGYPVLATLQDAYQVTFAGQGTLDDPYVVGSKRELLAISQDCAACYRLTADIDLQGMPSA